MMIPICSGVTMANAIRRDCFGRNTSHATRSSASSVYATVAAWNECGRRCCVYQPIHVGSGPFS